MNKELKESLRTSYRSIYQEEDKIEQLFEKIEKVLERYSLQKAQQQWITQKDVMLITYGDTLKDGNRPGLEVLKEFLDNYVKDAISSVHLLPMYPYTSDDGFSVVDYKQVDASLGTWEEVNRLAAHYKLMFDGVINHISKSSDWFQRFLKGEQPYCEYFIEADPKADYSSVTRPRALPLLSEFVTSKGKKYLWTTFSEDQIDLNYNSIEVYAQILDVLLFYVQNGAKYIRLDAIGFLWKKLGTTCMHLKETHEVIQSYRKLLDVYAPGTLLITETNVPHKDNISYLGGEKEEAHLIYQFPLPPLVMFSLQKGDCTRLSQWAGQIEQPKPGTTYFNFLSSHDGVGLRPVEGILTPEEQEFLVTCTLKGGGAVSYKDNGDGTKSPYELNINYQDALSSPEESDDIRIKKLLAAETILLSFQGLPGIYIHSLLGSRNDYFGRTTTGIPRRINREKLDLQELELYLNQDTSRKRIFNELIRRINIRKEHAAFSPDAYQEIVTGSPEVFQMVRTFDSEKITIYVNVSLNSLLLKDEKARGTDLFTGERINGSIALLGLQCIWLLEE